MNPNATNPDPTPFEETYNGYPTYEHWNVALWLANEYPWYRTTVELCKECESPSEVAGRIIAEFPTETPDGVLMTRARVLYAIADDFDEYRECH